MTVVLRNKNTMNVYEFSEIKNYWTECGVIHLLFKDNSIKKFTTKEFVIGVVYD